MRPAPERGYIMSVYTAILKPYDGGYTVEVPDVPGCVTGGESVEDAVRMARDALCGCLSVYEDERNPPPPSRLPADFTLQDGEIATLVDVDLDEYRRRTDYRAVRRNVSMPAWLSRLADQRGVNCSQVLQDALRAMLGQ